MKVIVVVSTAWFTVAFLLYSENSRPINSLQPVPPGEMAMPPDTLKRDAPKRLESAEKADIVVREKDDDIPEKVAERDNEVDNDISDNNAKKAKNEENAAVLVEPDNQYGEMGKAVVLPTNLSVEVKKLVDRGWAKNAFNQYASDLISIKRTLPDPRDEW